MMKMNRIAAFLAGLLFGVGLSVSQMINPAKVIAFLDVAGRWDPSLAFVMGGAVLVTAVGFRWALAWPRPLFAAVFRLPTAREVDARLVVGAALFGVGWGMSGFCPGPAIASLAYGLLPSVVFVASMVAGMALQAWSPAANRPAVATAPSRIDG
jgi:hypothetical protein